MVNLNYNVHVYRYDFNFLTIFTDHSDLGGLNYYLHRVIRIGGVRGCVCNGLGTWVSTYLYFVWFILLIEFTFHFKTPCLTVVGQTSLHHSLTYPPALLSQHPLQPSVPLHHTELLYLVLLCLGLYVFLIHPVLIFTYFHFFGISCSHLCPQPSHHNTFLSHRDILPTPTFI